MSSILQQIAEAVALACQLASVAYVAVGAVVAVAWTIRRWRDFADLQLKRALWRRFAANMIVALEFALAGDIAETAVAPTWEPIGRLAAIAAIRTALNYFLNRDLAAEEAARAQRAAT